MKISRTTTAVVVCVLSVLGLAGAAYAVDAPRWVAALYVEQQKVVDLRWMPVPGASGYQVFRSESAGKDQQQIASVTTPQHLDSGVEPGATYFYSLKAVAGAEASAFSEERSVAIPGAKKSGVEAPELDKVGLTVATEFGKSVYKVGVTWRPKGAAAIAFNLYRSTQTGVQGDMVFSGQETRYIDVAVEPGKTYYYSVTAMDSSFVETKPSAATSVEVKAPEAAAAAPKIAKKEYPKLVPIPIVKGREQRLPSDPYDAVLAPDGAIYIAAARLYKLEEFGGELKDITPAGVDNVMNIGIGIDDEILATVANSPKFLVIAGTKIKEGELLPLTKPMLNADKKEVGIRPPRPIDIIQNVDGKYWVSDNPNNRVVIFEDNLKLIGNAAAGTPEELAGNVTSLAHDSKGKVFAAVGANNSVSMYDKDGNFTGSFGETGNIAGTFGRIGGLFVDASDNIWITDYFNHTVQKFDNAGKFLGAFSSADGKGGPGLSTPGVVALDKTEKKGFVTLGMGKSLLEITVK